VPAVGENGDARLGKYENDGDGDWVGDDGVKEFEVSYDKLILAPGSETNAFGTKGVDSFCHTLKTVADRGD
jgi:NADH:ubiquinone reductase (non-electrogenic)